jgi:hypothetical protein
MVMAVVSRRAGIPTVAISRRAFLSSTTPGLRLYGSALAPLEDARERLSWTPQTIARSRHLEVFA